MDCQNKGISSPRKIVLLQNTGDQGVWELVKTPFYALLAQQLFGGCLFYFLQLPLKVYLLGVIFSLLVLFLLLVQAFGQEKKRVELEADLLELQEEFSQFRAVKSAEEEERMAYFLTWVHQMKTPITAAQLVLQSENWQEHQGELVEQLLAIENYTNLAMRYLQLLEHQNEAIDLYLDTVCLDHVLTPLFKKYALQFIRRRNQLIYTPIQKEVVGDMHWISILLEQFLSNALKYTQAGEVRVFFEEKRQCLVIQDTGTGIRKSDLPKIFTLGFSGFNGQQKEKSSGLGLFLAQKIAERLQYSIRIESQWHQGTTVYLDFNLTKL